MHYTLAGDRRKPLQKDAQDLAQDGRALWEAPRASATRRVRQGEANEAAAKSRGHQAPVQAGVQRGRNKPMF